MSANLDITSILWDILSSGTLQKISSNSWIDSKITGSILSQALPSLLKWLKNNTNTPEGVDSLFSALWKNHNGDILKSNSKIDTSDGKKILGHILGWEEKKILIWSISEKLGISWKQAWSTLDNLAPILLGALWKANKEWILQPWNIGNILWSKDIESSLLTSFLDKDGDGDIKDDLLEMWMNMAKGLFSKK